MIAEQKELGPNALKGRNEWYSLQWVSLLTLKVDTMEPMNVLSLTHQTFVDVPPFEEM